MCCNYTGIRFWNQRLGHKKTKLNLCHDMLTSSTQLQKWSFHVVERTRTSSKCQKMKNARAKRAKMLFFKYANLWGFCCRRRCGCLSSLLPLIGLLQLTITWRKIRHAGGQAHYYSRTGTSKQRQVKLHWFRSLCFNVPVRIFVPRDR